MSEIWPDCMIESHASVGAGLSCKGYGALLKERDALAARLAEAEAELAHIKRFLKPTGWQKAQDEHNALRAQLAEAQEELAQWRATGESVTRNEHDLSARLAGMQDLYVQACEQRDDALARLAEAEALLREWADSGVEYKSSKYRLTQIDHRTYLETVNFLAAGSAPAGDIPLRERLDPDGPGEGGRMKFSASVEGEK